MVPALKEDFWRGIMTPSCWLILALSAAAAPIAMWVLAADPYGELGWLGWLLICPGGLVTAWACVAALWRPDRDYGTLRFAALRSVVVPLFTVPLLGGVNVLVQYLPPVAGRIEEYTNPASYHPHYWFAQVDVPAPLMIIGGGIVASMVVGIFATAFLVWPINAIWKPERTIGESALDTSPQKRTKNRLAVGLYALILPLSFVLGLLWTLAENGTVSLWPVLAAALVLVALVYLAWRVQRVDHAKCARRRLRGLPNPDDPPPQ